MNLRAVAFVKSSNVKSAAPMIDGEDINPSDDGCPKCGNGMVTRTCGQCGGEGYTEPGELYEMDPLWYDVDDVEPCTECRGHGHHEWCQRCGWDVHLNGFLNGEPAIPLPPKCEKANP